MNEKVSILMTTYNDSNRLLREVIETILNQTYKNFEFIIVNDGSTDNCCEIISEYLHDKRIIFINRSENKGRVFSLNEGLSRVSSNFLFINDADDLPNAERISKTMNFYSKIKNKNEFGIIGGESLTNNNGNICKSKNIPFSVYKNKVLPWRMVLSLPFAHSTAVYNVKALKEIGGFPNSVTSSIDYFSLVKIYSKGYNIYYLESLLSVRNIDGKNFFMQKSITNKNNTENKLIIENWMKDNFPNYFLNSLPKKIYEVIKK